MYLEENEHMFQDVTLEQTVNYSKVIRFITSDKSSFGSLKLQNIFY